MSKRTTERASLEALPVLDAPNECVGLVRKIKGQGLFEICVPIGSFQDFVGTIPGGQDLFHQVLPVPSSIGEGSKRPSLPTVLSGNDAVVDVECGGASTTDDDYGLATFRDGADALRHQSLTFLFELPSKYRNTLWVKRGTSSLHSFIFCVFLFDPRIRIRINALSCFGRFPFAASGISIAFRNFLRAFIVVLVHEVLNSFSFFAFYWGFLGFLWFLLTLRLLLGSFVIVRWHAKPLGKISGEIIRVIFQKKQIQFINDELNLWPSIFNYALKSKTRAADDIWPSSTSSDNGDFDVTSSSSYSDSNDDSSSSSSSCAFSEIDM